MWNKPYYYEFKWSLVATHFVAVENVPALRITQTKNLRQHTSQPWAFPSPSTSWPPTSRRQQLLTYYRCHPHHHTHIHDRHTWFGVIWCVLFEWFTNYYTPIFVTKLHQMGEIKSEGNLTMVTVTYIPFTPSHFDPEVAVHLDLEGGFPCSI